MDTNKNTPARNIKNLLHERWGFLKSNVRARSIGNTKCEITCWSLEDLECTTRCLRNSGIVIEKIDTLKITVLA